MSDSVFKTDIARNIFYQKYAISNNQTWEEKSYDIVEDVCGSMWGRRRKILSQSEREQLVQYISEMKFLPGGRYIYYAKRRSHFWNNCLLLKAEEDTREEWAALAQRATASLMSGAGIGVDYSILRHKGLLLSRTGGISSGPLSLIHMINEIGRNVRQGGSRRSAIYASLSWKHHDIYDFLYSKDWKSMYIGSTGKTIADIKKEDFNFPAPLDMTNISVNYDDDFLSCRDLPQIFITNVRNALMHGEPGFSFNFGDKQNETLRNACVTGDTQILTEHGYYPIKDFVGREIKIWNGVEWSKVTPFSTGENPIVEVKLSDGSSLLCTEYHKFVLADGERKEATSLNAGDKLQKFSMPIIDGTGGDTKVPPYCQGFYAGDGNSGYKYSWVYKPKYSCIEKLQGLGYIKETKNPNRVYWYHGSMLRKDWVPINDSVYTKLQFLAGLVDADGTVTRDKNGNGIQIASVDLGFLHNLKLMLNTLGVQPKIVDLKPERMYKFPGDAKAYKCKRSYRLLIGNTDTYNLMLMGLKTYRLELHCSPPQRDARRFISVVSVEPLSIVEETFCFTEPKNNTGTFNGIVTGQCTEVTSEDDSDICNLGSINFARIEDITELKDVVYLASKFLVCGSMRADVPYLKVAEVREQNRRIGLGIMGIHEWLLRRGHRYEMNDELKQWLQVYKKYSESGANEHCDRFYLARPKGYRAIAPTGTTGLIASTTTGIEPLYAVAYKRRYLVGSSEWKYEYVIDSTAKHLIDTFGIKPEDIETSLDLAADPERRIKFQAEVQEYVDHAISSTINLPAWGTDLNNEDKVQPFAELLRKYAPKLRGFTCYPDGSRGGQPLTSVPYEEAVGKTNTIFSEHDVCDITGKGGTCGG